MRMMAKISATGKAVVLITGYWSQRITVQHLPSLKRIRDLRTMAQVKRKEQEA
jgi:hypothetical protein